MAFFADDVSQNAQRASPLRRRIRLHYPRRSATLLYEVELPPKLNVGRTLKPRLQDIEGMHNQGCYDTGREASNGLDKGGSECLTWRCAAVDGRHDSRHNLASMLFLFKYHKHAREVLLRDDGEDGGRESSFVFRYR